MNKFNIRSQIVHFIDSLYFKKNSSGFIVAVIQTAFLVPEYRYNLLIV